MIRFLRDDAVPVFVGCGRGSLGTAKAIHRAYGIVSRVYALPGEGNFPSPRRARFCRVLPVGDLVAGRALADFGRQMPVGRSLLLMPGTLRGASLCRALGEELAPFYLPAFVGELPPPAVVLPGDGIVTGYVSSSGTVVFSAVGRVSSVTKDGRLPSSVVRDASLPADFAPPQGGGTGFFTAVRGKDGVGYLPYLADGGFLFAAAGICAAETLLRDVVLREAPVSVPPVSGEAGCARGLRVRRWEPAPENFPCVTLAPPFSRALPWDLA